MGKVLTSLVWKATPSSTARTKCGLLVVELMPIATLSTNKSDSALALPDSRSQREGGREGGRESKDHTLEHRSASEALADQ